MTSLKSLAGILMSSATACSAIAAVFVACSSTSETADPTDASLEAAPARDANPSDTSEPEPEPDAATACRPQPLAEEPTWHPPTMTGQGACTQAQAEAYFSSCAGSGKTPAGCDAYRQQNAGCFTCVDTTAADSNWGPLTWFDDRAHFVINTPGCLASGLSDTSANGCGAALQMYRECARLACRGCTRPTTDALYEAFSACKNEQEIADICATHLAKLNVKCGGLDLDAGGPEVQRCGAQQGETPEEAARRYIKFWCVAPNDGG